MKKILKHKNIFVFIISAFFGIIISIQLLGISCGFHEYIQWSIEDGGSFSHAGTPYVVDGQITQAGIDACHNEGISDAEIAQWGANSSSSVNNNASSSDTNNTNSSEAPSSTNDTSVTNNNTSSSSTSSQAQNTPEVSYTEEEIEAAWEETNRVESTCSEAGYIEYTNSLTNETKVEELELAGHQYEETERIEPTCTEDGTVTYTCSVCGNTYDETLLATGHSYEWVTTKDANLFTEGLEEEACSVCGEKSGATHTLSAKCPIPLVGAVGLVIAACVVFGVIFYKRKKLTS